MLLSFICFAVFISLYFAFKSHRFGHQLAHIIPVGITQFADFVSDCFVLAEFHLDKKDCKLSGCIDHNVGRDDEFGICVAAIVLSIVFSLGLIWYKQWYSSIREGVLVSLLACVNLHVLYYGIQAVDSNAQEPKKSKKSFAVLKMIETGMESTFLALFTLRRIFRNPPGAPAADSLFYASLTLSVLSMAYVRCQPSAHAPRPPSLAPLPLLPPPPPLPHALHTPHLHLRHLHLCHLQLRHHCLPGLLCLAP